MEAGNGYLFYKNKDKTPISFFFERTKLKIKAFSLNRRSFQFISIFI